MRRFVCFLALLPALTGCGGSQTTDSPPAPTPTLAPSNARQASDTPSPSNAPPPTPTDATPGELALLAQNNAFGFDLYERLRTTPGNLVVSPASIGVALGMTYAGARGETATQMAQTLHFTGDSSALHRAYGTALRTWNGTNTATLRVANRIYVEQTIPLEGAFLALTRDTYGAEAQPVSFLGQPEAARSEINGWVEQRTAGQIRDLLPASSISSLTRLVLTNAVYFKGTWQTQFDPSRTRPHSFTLADGGTPFVSMMQLRDRLPYAHIVADGLRILELRYTGGDLSMVFLLPDAATGLPALEQKLSAEALERWRAEAGQTALSEPHYPEVDVGIPRVRLEPGTIPLSNTLKAMGMPLAFAQRGADFRGMATLPDGLFISEVFHKAFIEVNEEGTEAAAATAVVMATRGMASAEPDRPRFYADHPFIFLLMDRRTGAIMFLGRVSDPR